jgi:hypothetical protein
MFEILPNPSLETLLVVGRAVALVGALCVFALAFIRWRRADERNTASLQLQLERTFGEVRSLHETISVMSARMEVMSERTEMDTRLAPAVAGGSHRGYDMATRLARNGSGVDDLINNCGIARHEAELLVRLHGAKVRAPAAPPARTQHPPQDNGRVAERPAASDRQAVAQQPPAGAGRKRGSLLSVVG